MNGCVFEIAHPADHRVTERRDSLCRAQDRFEVDVKAEASAVAPALCVPAHAGLLCAAGGGSEDVAIGDWDELFSAVEARLTSTVGELLAALPETSALLSAIRIRTSVLECVAALHQLHATVTHELARRQRLVVELTDTQAALAEVRAEIAGLQSLR